MEFELDEFEQVAALHCLHTLYRHLNWKYAADVVKDLGKAPDGIAADVATRAVSGKAIGAKDRAKVARKALGLLVAKKPRVLELVQERCPRAKNYIGALLDRFSGSNTELGGDEAVATLDNIFANWRACSTGEASIYRRGAFQMVRRYKSIHSPDHTASKNMEPTLSHVPDILIFELLFIDPDRHEAILVTSEGNIYRGALFQNHEGLLAILFQRMVGGAKVNQRYFTERHEETDLAFYSGICVKMGDTSSRPVASEVILIPIPASDHGVAVAELERLCSRPWLSGHGEIVPPDSVLWDYMSDNPPSRPYNPNDPRDVPWQRVKFLEDFPEIQMLSKENAGVRYFNEPLRSISREALVALSQRNPPKVFRQSLLKRKTE